jgi:hypothetical protein
VGDNFAEYTGRMARTLEYSGNAEAEAFRVIGEAYDGRQPMEEQLLGLIERMAEHHRPAVLVLLRELVTAARSQDYNRGWRDGRDAANEAARAPVIADSAQVTAYQSVRRGATADWVPGGLPGAGPEGGC